MGGVFEEQVEASHPWGRATDGMVFPDAVVMGSEKQISPGPGGLEKKPGHREVAEEGPPAPRTQEQRHLAESGKKQDQARSGSSSGVLPSWAPAVYEESQPQGADKEIEDQQATQQSPRTVEEGQATESCQDHTCQPTPGHQEGNGADTVQLTETCCTVDSCGQQLGGQVPKETGAPQTRPRETRSEPEPAEQEDGSHEDMLTAMQREDIDDFLPSFVPASKLYKERGETVEAQRTQGAVSPPEIRKTEEWRLLNSSQKQPQQPVLASTAQSLKSTYQGFMKCLLEVEEEEALIRRAAKARVLHNRKSPRTLTPVPIPTAAANSTPCLTQSHNSSSATSWGRQPSPVSVVSPSVAIPAPASMSVSFPDWRRIEFLNQNSERNLGCTKARPEMDGSNLLKLFQNWKEKSEEHLTLKQEEAFRSYFDIFKGHGEVDARSLENTLLFVGISLMPAQVEAALMSADIDGDGHVSFKDFLAVMTDTKRFFCSVEQNTLTDMTPSNPHTLFFEILSLLVEMLALPETALEEITTYYQKKLKEGTTKVQEIESTIGRLRARKKPPYPQQQQAENLDVPERRVLRILSKLKQQNYGDNLQSPYAQVPCIPLCPRLDKKMICRRQQGNHYVLDQYTPTYLGPDIRSLFCQPGSQGNREHSTDGRKWFGSVLARTH